MDLARKSPSTPSRWNNRQPSASSYLASKYLGAESLTLLQVHWSIPPIALGDWRFYFLVSNCLRQLSVFVLFHPIAWGKWAFSFCFVQLPEANWCFRFVSSNCLRQMDVFVLFRPIAWSKLVFLFCFVQLPEANGHFRFVSSNCLRLSHISYWNIQLPEAFAYFILKHPIA